jgi:hypothetical protein
LQTLSETDYGSNDFNLSQDEYILGSGSGQSSVEESLFFNKIAEKNNSSESEDEENVLINIDSNPGSTSRKRILKKKKR